MRFALPIACVLTFCIVCIGYSDAIIPFGYLLAKLLKEESMPKATRILLLIPFMGTLLPSLLRQTLARGILTIIGITALIGLWIFGVVVFVLYPMPDNRIPNAVPAVTSVPFLLMATLTIIHSVRIMRRPNQIN